MRDQKGRFVKGEHYNQKTEFKPGEHWRPHQAFREKEYLNEEYINKQRSASDIAREFNVGDTAILFWLAKHDIPRRGVSQARAIKHWGAGGEKNPMFGKKGEDSVNWRGGVTPERQRVYSSLEWSNAARIVWERDGGKCTECGREERRPHYIHIHHDKPFDTFPEDRCDPANLRLVCSQCHPKFHKRKRGGDAK
jgi:5-methylcytosine-specific restriction protein A